MPARRIRSWARAGLLDAARGPGNHYRFSFPDIILLRTAQELQAQGVPARRIGRALRSLRGQLPAGRPLSAVRIAAVGDEVLVRDRDRVWAPLSEQVAFDFAVEELAARVAPFAPRAAREREAEGEMDADDWYDLGFDLEAVSIDEASRAYRRALGLSAAHPEALVNLGRLLHEQGEPGQALAHYERALELAPSHALARFNRGVALEDLGRHEVAREAYLAALERDPELAGAHFNLSRLYEAEGDLQAALRHLTAYKRLRERGVFG